MGKSSRVNALLVEILLAILFFALAATVILRCFSAAYEQASRADARDRALAGAQNVAAALCASVDPEQALRELTIMPMDNGIACESVDADTGECTTGSAFATCAGFLCHALLTACKEGSSCGTI